MSRIDGEHFPRGASTHASQYVKSLGGSVWLGTSPDTSESAEKVYTEQLHHRGSDPHGLAGVKWPELRTVYEGPNQG